MINWKLYHEKNEERKLGCINQRSKVMVILIVFTQLF